MDDNATLFLKKKVILCNVFLTTFFTKVEALCLAYVFVFFNNRKAFFCAVDKWFSTGTFCVTYRLYCEKCTLIVMTTARFLAAIPAGSRTEEIHCCSEASPQNRVQLDFSY